LVDHRPLGLGSADAAQFVEIYRSLADMAPDVWAGIIEAHGVTEQGACFRANLRGTREGGPFRTPSALVVMLAEDGKLTHAAFLPADESERGLALLAGHDIEATTLENAASRLATANAGRLLAEPGVTEPHRTVLAVRGDRLCLIKSTLRREGADEETLEVHELDELGGRLRTDTLASDQLEEAFALLDERFLAGEGAPFESAWRAMFAVLDGMNSHDVDAIRAATHDDVVLHDHRLDVWVSLAKDEYLALYPSIYEELPDVRWPVLRDLGVSARGASVEMDMRGTRPDGGTVSTWTLTVFELRDGRCSRLDIYSPEDRAAADRRFAELAEAVLENAATRWSDAAVARMFEGDWDGLERLFAADVVIRDHRLLVGGTELVGRAAATSGFRALVELGISDFSHRFLAVRGHRLSLRHSTVVGDGAQEEILEFDELDESGLEIRSDTFSVDQIDEAFALLDERFIQGEGAAHATKWRVLTEMADAMSARDLGAIRSLVTSDFTMVDHRPASLGTASLEEWFGMFPVLYERSDDVRWWTLADCQLSDGAVLRIHESRGTTRDGGGEFSSTYFVVSEFRGDAPCRNDFYSLEEGAAAEQRFAEINLGGAALQNAATRAAADSDVVAIRGEQLGLVRARDGLHLIETDAMGRVVKTDVFTSDKLDDAIELLDERFLEDLPTEGAGWRAWARAVRPMNARDLEALRTAMTEDFVFADHRALSFGTLDREGYLAVFPPLYEMSLDVRWTMVSDVDVADHAACFVFQIEGTTNEGGRFTVLPWVVALERDGLVAHMEAFTSADEAKRRFGEVLKAESGQTPANAATRAAPVPHEVIAIRGDRLALTQRGLDGRQILDLTEVDEHGALVRSEMFELDQLDEGVALLEERFLTTLGAVGDGWAVLVRLIDAANRRSLDDLHNTMAEDFDIVDHRPLSLGTVDRNVYLSSLQAIFDQSTNTRFTVIRDYGVAKHVVCFYGCVHGTTNDGGLFDNFLWMTTVERDGLMAHMEDFATRDDAMARFAELAAASDELANAATRVNDAFGAAYARADFDALGELLADDIALRDTRPLVGLELVGKDDAVQAIKAIRDVGGTQARWEQLAIRGDRLALSRLVIGGTASEVEVVQLQELDANGRMCRWTTYELDDLDAALVELDEWFLASVAVQGGAWRAIARATQAMTRRDLDGVRAAMTEDFVFVDHRPLSVGTVDRDQYLRYLAPLFDETPDVRWTMVSNHGITDHVACGLIRHSGTTNEGGRFENPVWGVLSERDHLWSRVEAFTTREEAVARFREVTAADSIS
jgi:ketosteroid isomerase-like protein